MCADRRLLDRVLAATFIEGLDRLPPTELRERRRECERVESELSMQRSMLHGTLDILRAELERRSATNPEAASILDRLASTFVRPASSSRGARPKMVVPDEWGQVPAEQLLSEGLLARVSEMPEREIEATIVRVSDQEREVSAQRRGVQQVLDVVQEAILACYSDGRANPMDLLGEGGTSP